MRTGTSRLYGLGFALIQRARDGQSITQCGSCSLSKTQQRYATIELECLAIKWAVNKCNLYLRCLPAFTVLTDHRPLVGIFCKQLHELENTRLMHMREKLTNFSFEVKLVEGKTYMIADALSRAPVFQPEEEEEEMLETAIHCLQVRETSELTDIEEAIDEHYSAIVLANFKQLPGHHPANKPLNVCDQLSIAKLGETEVIMLDGRMIVVPKGARRNIIAELHRAHSGMTKSFKTAKIIFLAEHERGAVQGHRRLPALPGGQTDPG